METVRATATKVREVVFVLYNQPAYDAFTARA